MKRLLGIGVVSLWATFLACCTNWGTGGLLPAPTPTPFVPSASHFWTPIPIIPVTITIHNGMAHDPVPYFERTNCGNHPWPFQPPSASVPAQGTKLVYQDFATSCFRDFGDWADILVESSPLMQATWCEVRAANVGINKIAFTIDYAGASTDCHLTSTPLSATLDFALAQ